MLRVIKYYKVGFAFSSLLALASLVMFFLWGLKPGIDFRGGTLSQLEFENEVNAGDTQTALKDNGFVNVIVQPVSSRALIIKTESLDEAQIGKLKETLAQKMGTYKELKFEAIGPAISKELVRKAYWQIGLVVLGILLYVAYAFRNTGKGAKNAGFTSWRMGVAAIIALIHDLFITVGVFVLLGRYRGVEVDGLFVTALLTILGFSVHDTIVVFDRIRESLQKYPYKSLDEVIDYSINSALVRSINTSATLIFVLTAMVLFGGQTISNFVLALLVGVTIGTYSSIFIASPLLYFWPFARQKNQSR